MNLKNGRSTVPVKFVVPLTSVPADCCGESGGGGGGGGGWDEASWREFRRALA